MRTASPMHSRAARRPGRPTESLMRRTLLAPLLLSLPTLLAGCTGFGTFLDNTVRLPGENPNLPQADSENVRRSLGQPAPAPPLTPEPGDVWPAPTPPAPTLGQVERNPTLQEQFAPTTVPGERFGLPAGHEPVPTGRPTEQPPPLPNAQPNAQPNARPNARPNAQQRRRGSSTPPGSVEPGLEPALPPVQPPLPPTPPNPSVSPPPGGAVQLPNGVGVDTGGTRSYRQLTLPNGQPGAIVVPNGNGTSTVIGPDGSVTTIPTPGK